MSKLSLELTLAELQMLRHALRIGAEDGSLLNGTPQEDRLYDRLARKLDKAIQEAPKPYRRGQ